MVPILSAWGKCTGIVPAIRGLHVGVQYYLALQGAMLTRAWPGASSLKILCEDTLRRQC